MLEKINFKSGLILITSIFFIVFTFYGFQILFADNVQVDKPDRVLIIPKGATFQQVVDSLEMNKITHDRLSFMFLSKLTGYKENVKPGRYLLKSNSNNYTLLKALIKGRQTPLKLTFNNIRLKEELVEKIGSKFAFGADSLAYMLNNPSITSQYGFDTSTVMSIFIPNTYEYYYTISATEFLDKMFKEYQKFWTEERKQKANAIGLTQSQVSILASIVEEETKQNDEKPVVAGVYLNRLRKGQRLEADPTVKFALKDFSIKRVYNVHTKTESPYNTYRNNGLPPGPICLPMISSLDAVLNVAKHEYYFFCADLSKPGYHTFTKNYDDHRKTAKDYRTTLDKRNIH